MDSQSPLAPRLSVSLIATVFNEGDTIDAWLATVAAQTRMPDQIVVVDAGSTDGTIERLRAAATTLPLDVVVAEGANVPQGRNEAFRHATGEVIAITDAGTLLDQRWLQELVAPLEGDARAGVSAGYFVPHGYTPFEQLLAVTITPRWNEIDPATFLPSSRSVAVRREWWSRAGGYPAWLRAGEDLLFSMRLRETGATFVMAPDALVAWRPRATLRGFFKQYRHYARGDGHAHLWTKRHVARYSAYTVGALLLWEARRSRWASGLLAVGFVGYMRRFWGRVVAEGLADGPVDLAALLAGASLIVVVGDVAKMIGYPQGLHERWKAGSPEALEDAGFRSHRADGGD